MEINPPKADKIEKILEIHNDIRVDPYYWLNDRNNEEVIDYLERENDYYEKMTAHSRDFQKKLFEEMKGRIKEDDESVPYMYNGMKKERSILSIFGKREVWMQRRSSCSM